MVRAPIPEEGVVVEEMGDELCLMRLDTSAVMVLNRTASDVWLLLSDGVEVEQLIANLSAAYQAPADEVGRGVRDLLAELLARGFVVERA